MDATKAITEAIDRFRKARTAPLILELDLTEGVVDGPPTDPLSAVMSMRRPRLTDILSGLKRARGDERVRALIVKIGGHPIEFGTVQELRAAIQAFRRSGGRTVAFAETFGEFGAGTVPYYLATACETICLQPSGDVGLTGVALQQHFFKDALGKAGVAYQVAQRHEYKTAANTFTQDHMTEAHREMVTRIAESVTEQIVAGIAEARGLAPARVRELVDEGPFIGAEAVRAGLVDRLAYRDEVYADLKAGVRSQTGQEPHLQYVTRYHRHLLGRKMPRPGEQVVALIHGHGAIRLGRSGRSPFGGGAMGSDTICAALRAARRDEKVKAVVFRVDSPGGSYVASDAICNTMTPQNAEWGRAEDHAWALSVAERTLRVVRGEPLRLPDALDLLTVDDDVGGPFPPGPRDAFPATLRSSGAEVTEVAQPTPGRPLVIAVYADIRGWKGRAGLSTRAVAAVANALEVAPDATVVLFGHPRLAAELPAKATHVLAAWGGERLMQEAAARRLAAGRTDE